MSPANHARHTVSRARSNSASSCFCAARLTELRVAKQRIANATALFFPLMFSVLSIDHLGFLSTESIERQQNGCAGSREN